MFFFFFNPDTVAVFFFVFKISFLGGRSLKLPKLRSSMKKEKVVHLLYHRSATEKLLEFSIGRVFWGSINPRNRHPDFFPAQKVPPVPPHTSLDNTTLGVSSVTRQCPCESTREVSRTMSMLRGVVTPADDPK